MFIPYFLCSSWRKVQVIQHWASLSSWEKFTVSIYLTYPGEGCERQLALPSCQNTGQCLLRVPWAEFWRVVSTWSRRAYLWPSSIRFQTWAAFVIIPGLKCVKWKVVFIFCNSTRLASLFGLDQAASGHGNEFFQYTAPKQPKKGQGTAPTGKLRG